jgi:hypothetical protein
MGAIEPAEIKAARLKDGSFGVAIEEIEQETETASLVLAPTDLAKIVTVNEARASQGLGELKGPGGGNDPDGYLTIAEFEAKRSAKGEATGTAEAPATEPPANAPPAQPPANEPPEDNGNPPEATTPEE